MAEDCELATGILDPDDGSIFPGQDDDFDNTYYVAFKTPAHILLNGPFYFYDSQDAFVAEGSIGDATNTVPETPYVFLKGMTRTDYPVYVMVPVKCQDGYMFNDGSTEKTIKQEIFQTDFYLEPIDHEANVPRYLEVGEILPISDIVIPERPDDEELYYLAVDVPSHTSGFIYVYYDGERKEMLAASGAPVLVVDGLTEDSLPNLAGRQFILDLTTDEGYCFSDRTHSKNITIEYDGNESYLDTSASGALATPIPSNLNTMCETISQQDLILHELDENGNEKLLFPITRVENVENAITNITSPFDGRLTIEKKKGDVFSSNNIDLTLEAKLPAEAIPYWHRNHFRGKFIGTSVTAEQSQMIANWTFDDLYTGDYWTINGTNYRIADINYYLDSGDIACAIPHVVVISEKPMYNAQMNTENIVTGAYVGSLMYTTNLDQAKTKISTDFDGHLLTIRKYFQNTVSGAYETNGAWYDATVWLMNEINVYGSYVSKSQRNGINFGSVYSEDKTQFAIFALNTKMCNPNRDWWWLRDVISSTGFSSVSGYGGCNNMANSFDLYGVRPAFVVI